MKNKVFKDTFKLVLVTFALNIPLFLIRFCSNFLGFYIPFESEMIDCDTLNNIAFYVFAYVYIIVTFSICSKKLSYTTKSIGWYFLIITIGSCLCSIINMCWQSWLSYMLFNVTVYIDEHNSFIGCFIFMVLENMLKTIILFLGQNKRIAQHNAEK